MVVVLMVRLVSGAEIKGRLIAAVVMVVVSGGRETAVDVVV